MTARLAVWAVAGEALLFPARHFGSMARFILLPALTFAAALLGAFIVFALLLPPVQKDGELGPFWTYEGAGLIWAGAFGGVTIAGALLALSMTTLAVHRLAALGVKPEGSVLRMGGAVWRVFAGRIFLISTGVLVSVAVSTVMDLCGLYDLANAWREQIVNPKNGAEKGVFLRYILLTQAMRVAPALAWIVVFIRLVAFLPAAACEGALSLRRALDLSRGHFWGLASVLLLTFVATLLIQTGLAALLIGAGAGLWALHTLLDFGHVATLYWVGAVLFLVAYALALLYLSALQLALPAVAYRHLAALAD